MLDLQAQLVQLAPKALLDPREVPVLGARLARLESLDQPDLLELLEVGSQARQAYLVLREALDPKVRLALLELRARLVKLARPEQLVPPGSA